VIAAVFGVAGCAWLRALVDIVLASRADGSVRRPLTEFVLVTSLLEHQDRSVELTAKINQTLVPQLSELHGFAGRRRPCRWLPGSSWRPAAEAPSARNAAPGSRPPSRRSIGLARPAAPRGRADTGAPGQTSGPRHANTTRDIDLIQAQYGRRARCNPRRAPGRESMPRRMLGE
jgi:hypothetical protein